MPKEEYQWRNKRNDAQHINIHIELKIFFWSSFRMVLNLQCEMWRILLFEISIAILTGSIQDIVHN